MIKMMGYKPYKHIEYTNVVSFKEYEKTIAPFAIKRLAKLCNYTAWMTITYQGCIYVVYTIGNESPISTNILVPYVPKDPHNYMGSIEEFGYAYSAAQYLACAFSSNVGTLYKAGAGKMFNGVTMEQLHIDIDLQFEGDRNELMHVL